MERFFILSNDSELVQDFTKYNSMKCERLNFVEKFCRDNGIEASEFIVGGNGFVNRHFEEDEKSEIYLSITPTEKDSEKFDKVLTKENSSGMRSFRKNSSIGKDFANKCVENKIVINLYKPDMMDYFKTVGLSGNGWMLFKHNDTYYLKIDCRSLTEDDAPEGFTVIKASEYYEAMEEYEKRLKN